MFINPDQLPSGILPTKHSIAPVAVDTREAQANRASPTAGEILRAMGKTFDERNAAYGNNYKMVGPMMAILFPGGVPTSIVHGDAFHLFELILVKLSRFAISGMTHDDSIHDAGVYCAMVEMILKERAREQSPVIQG